MSNLTTNDESVSGKSVTDELWNLYFGPLGTKQNINDISVIALGLKNGVETNEMWRAKDEVME